MPTTMTPLAANILCAAELLEGMDLANGWKVTTKVPRHSTSTGGNFSVPYFVEKGEGKSAKRAFLKSKFRNFLFRFRNNPVVEFA